MWRDAVWFGRLRLLADGGSVGTLGVYGNPAFRRASTPGAYGRPRMDASASPPAGECAERPAMARVSALSPPATLPGAPLAGLTRAPGARPTFRPLGPTSK